MQEERCSRAEAVGRAIEQVANGRPDAPAAGIRSLCGSNVSGYCATMSLVGTICTNDPQMSGVRTCVRHGACRWAGCCWAGNAATRATERGHGRLEP